MTSHWAVWKPTALLRAVGSGNNSQVVGFSTLHSIKDELVTFFDKKLRVKVQISFFKTQEDFQT